MSKSVNHVSGPFCQPCLRTVPLRSLTSHCSGPAAVASFLRSGRMHDVFTQPRHAARSSAAHRACRAATWTGGRGPLSSSVRPAMRLSLVLVLLCAVGLSCGGRSAGTRRTAREPRPQSASAPRTLVPRESAATAPDAFGATGLLGCYEFRLPADMPEYFGLFPGDRVVRFELARKAATDAGRFVVIGGPPSHSASSSWAFESAVEADVRWYYREAVVILAFRDTEGKL